MNIVPRAAVAPPVAAAPSASTPASEHADGGNIATMQLATPPTTKRAAGSLHGESEDGSAKRRSKDTAENTQRGDYQELRRRIDACELHALLEEKDINDKVYSLKRMNSKNCRYH